MINSSMSPTTSTIISEMTVRIIFLRVSGVKPVIRVDSVILALRASRFVARLPQSEFELDSLLRVLLAAGLDPRKGRFHAKGLKPVEHFLGHHPVGARPTENYAPRRGEMIESADALVARLSITVTDMKLPPTPRTAEETSQQGFASADGAAAHEPLAVGVVGDQVLIPLKLDPGNVTLMMILD